MWHRRCQAVTVGTPLRQCEQRAVEHACAMRQMPGSAEALCSLGGCARNRRRVGVIPIRPLR